MAVREILRMCNPRLRRKASAIDRLGNDKLASLINGMLDTMKDFEGRVWPRCSSCKRHEPVLPVWGFY